jgi:hypothetical protein
MQLINAQYLWNNPQAQSSSFLIGELQGFIFMAPTSELSSPVRGTLISHMANLQLIFKIPRLDQTADSFALQPRMTPHQFSIIRSSRPHHVIGDNHCSFVQQPEFLTHLKLASQ